MPHCKKGPHLLNGINNAFSEHKNKCVRNWEVYILLQYDWTANPQISKDF